MSQVKLILSKDLKCQSEFNFDHVWHKIKNCKKLSSQIHQMLNIQVKLMILVQIHHQNLISYVNGSKRLKT